MRSLLLAAIPIVVCLYPCRAQEESVSRQVGKWVRLSPPTGDTWRTANRSPNEWHVDLEDGVVCAKRRDARRITGDPPPFTIPTSKAAKGRKFVIKVDNGWLIGYNAGEWGGSLWWFAPDGSRKAQISKDQIAGFFRTGGRIYALEGLAHLGMSRGKIIRIDKDENTGNWRSSAFVKLPEAPNAATVDRNGPILVVTTSSLVHVSPSGEVKTLLEKAFWRGLYPSSIVLDANGVAYIGMRQGVARVSSLNANPQVEWLVPGKDTPKE